MSYEVMRESAETLHGQLQRGLGRAARRAADVPGAGEYVYDCVLRDPRLDGQCEDRAVYYARLVVDLELPCGPLAEHLFGPGDGDPDEQRVLLTLDVLTALVRLSRREAALHLRRYAEEGTHWFRALEVLAELGDPVLAGGLDDLVVSRCDEESLRWLVTDPGNPVVASWAARQPRIAAVLAERADRLAGGGASRPTRSRAADRNLSEDDLVEAARGGGDTAVAALFELARRRSPALLDLAEQLLDRRPGRLRGVLARAVRDLGADALPRARVWAAAGRERTADIGLDIVARHGTRQDIPVLMRDLCDAVGRREWTAAATPISGLGRLRAGEAVETLKSVWVESEYSYLRPRVLSALQRTAPHSSEAFTVEGLWDGEPEVRDLAVRSAPLTPETRVRLRRLERDDAEEPGVRAAALTRLT